MKGSTLFKLGLALAIFGVMFGPLSPLRAAEPPKDSVALAWSWSVANGSTPVADVRPAKGKPACECGDNCPCPAGACAAGNCATKCVVPLNAAGVATIGGKAYQWRDGYLWAMDGPTQSSEPTSAPVPAARAPKYFNKDGTVCVECEQAESDRLARLAAKSSPVTSFTPGVPNVTGFATPAAYTVAGCASGNCGSGSTTVGPTYSTPFAVTGAISAGGSAGGSRGGFLSGFRERRDERKSRGGFFGFTRGGGCASCGG